MPMMRFQLKGFTLLEMIMVILLVSVLSAYAAFHFVGRSEFSAQAAQQQAISIIRQVQLGRMQSNVEANNLSDQYKLNISSNCLGSVAACKLSGNSRLSRSDYLYLDIPTNAKIGFSSSLTSSSTVEFTLLGAPKSGKVTITINNGVDSETEQVCINKEGYVHTGKCT